MNKIKSIFIPINKCFHLALLSFAVLLGGSFSAFGQDETSNFAVLSAADNTAGAVYCTDSTITGNVGSSGALLQNGCSISGELVPQASEQILTDFDTLHTELSNTACHKTLSGNLDGITLKPGVYCFNTQAILTGRLVLNGPADGNWTFKVGVLGGEALIANNFSIVMEGGAQDCNVWWVASGVTLTSSQFIGSLLSSGAIAMTGGSFSGRLLGSESVILTGISATGCESTVIE
jgi:hypothetical protein